MTAALTATKRNLPPDDGQRWAHVRRVQDEHPPIDAATVDLSIRRPDLVLERFGVVLDYMARAELEVERNVLELATLLQEAPEIDQYFYRDVWLPQETQHGVILDELLVVLGHRAAVTDLTTVSPKIRMVGAFAHLAWFHDVVRMLYYLTGMTTERSALLAYHRLQDGLSELGETALAETVITPIRRQEPGHYAYYQMSARALWGQLAVWQRLLVRRLRALSFTPVGANTREQTADVGDMMRALGLETPSMAGAFTEQVARVECELLWAHKQGMKVPPYVARAFAEAVQQAFARTN